MDDTGFELWWKEYPRKDNKAGALKSWGKLDMLERNRAVDHTRKMVANDYTWQREHHKFNVKIIPHGTTYLNQKRFDDDIVEKVVDKDPTRVYHPSLKDFEKTEKVVRDEDWHAARNQAIAEWRQLMGMRKT